MGADVEYQEQEDWGGGEGRGEGQGGSRQQQQSTACSNKNNRKPRRILPVIFRNHLGSSWTRAPPLARFHPPHGGCFNCKRQSTAADSAAATAAPPVDSAAATAAPLVRSTFAYIRLGGGQWKPDTILLYVDHTVSFNSGPRHGSYTYEWVNGGGTFKLEFHHAANLTLLRTMEFRQVPNTDAFVHHAKDPQWSVVLIPSRP